MTEYFEQDEKNMSYHEAEMKLPDLYQLNLFKKHVNCKYI